MPGPYCNSTEQYIESQDVMDAHWLVDDETNALYIVARDGDEFEGYGDDDETLSALFSLTDAQLSDDAFMEEKGFSLVYPPLRRFSTEIGHYAA